MPVRRLRFREYDRDAGRFEVATRQEHTLWFQRAQSSLCRRRESRHNAAMARPGKSKRSKKTAKKKTTSKVANPAPAQPIAKKIAKKTAKKTTSKKTTPKKTTKKS